MNLYRLVVVASVFQTGKSVRIGFEDFLKGVTLSPEFLSEKGVGEIRAGQKFFIKGRHGNEDEQLRHRNCLIDIQIAHAA